MKMRMLAVDDAPQVLMVVKAMLEHFGMEVETSSDSRQALDRIQSESFDGFILDATMPEVDGFELAHTIRTSPGNSRAVLALLTGNDDLDTRRKGLRAGFTMFFGKPFTLERAATLRNVMKGMISNEKRQVPRLPFRTSVKCSFHAESVNIGEGGMLLESSGGIDVGQMVRLEFRMPNCPQILKPQAKVIRKDAGHRIAVQFIDIASEDRQRIREYIFGPGEW